MRVTQEPLTTEKVAPGFHLLSPPVTALMFLFSPASSLVVIVVVWCDACPPTPEFLALQLHRDPWWWSELNKPCRAELVLFFVIK